MAGKQAVVVAVDFSAISEAVLDTGCALARRLGGNCRVAHVLDVLPDEREAGPLLPFLRRSLERMREGARADLAALAAAASGDVEVTAELLEGKVSERLVGLVRECGARLLVIGGPHPLRSPGSIAERVARHSPVPVLVVRRAGGGGYRRALVGVDRSASSARALAEAAALLEGDGRLQACHVVNTWGLPATPELAGAAEELRAELGAWVSAQAGGRPVPVTVEFGRPATVLLEAAGRERADLLAVGSRGHGPLSHLFLGSVAEAAARKAPCDVLVCGADPAEGEAR